jgi:hypothetical protein
VARTDGVIMVGAATSAANQVICFGGARDGMSAAATDRYAFSGECLANKTLGGRSITARASLTQWNANGFRLNWAEVSGTVRHYMALAIKGGHWAAGATTLNVTALNNVTTVSGLPFAPVGLSLVSHITSAQPSDNTTTYDVVCLGTGASPTSRRAIFVQSNDAGSTAQTRQAIEYDAILVNTDGTGTTNILVDVNAMTADGFQLIVDMAAPPWGTIWIGYLAYG